MSSPYSCPEEGWSICSSLKTNSVDCDLLLEFDTPPGSNENFDIIKTDESVDGAPSIISCSPTNTTTSFHTACENFLPYPADISQWVHQQSLLVGSPLERTTNSVASSPDTKEINMFPESLDDSVEAFEPSPMVYDIPTLLFLGKMPMSHMTELRVHSGALAGEPHKLCCIYVCT